LCRTPGKAIQTEVTDEEQGSEDTQDGDERIDVRQDFMDRVNELSISDSASSASSSCFTLATVETNWSSPRRISRTPCVTSCVLQLLQVKKT
jgi:hypothetical protein